MFKSAILFTLCLLSFASAQCVNDGVCTLEENASFCPDCRETVESTAEPGLKINSSHLFLGGFMVSIALMGVILLSVDWFLPRIQWKKRKVSDEPVKEEPKQQKDVYQPEPSTDTEKWIEKLKSSKQKK
ncbi:hypothetical protein K8R43_03820 [archaeon]|nr:hypothetical protein [archaeon]